MQKQDSVRRQITITSRDLLGVERDPHQNGASPTTEVAMHGEILASADRAAPFNPTFTPAAFFSNQLQLRTMIFQKIVVD